jgi:hypothetical protein
MCESNEQFNNLSLNSSTHILTVEEYNFAYKNPDIRFKASFTQILLSKK